MGARTRRRRARRESPRRILVIIENVSFARDHRARKQVDSLLKAGYRVGVICRRDPDNARYEAPGLRIYQYRPPPERPEKIFFFLEYCYSLVAAAFLFIHASLDGSFQAVQVGHPPDVYFLIGLPAKLAGVRFVVDQRDLSPEMYADRFAGSRGFLPATLRALERASWRAADHIICVNQTLLHSIARRGGISSSKITVVGNGPRLASVARRTARQVLAPTHRHLVCWLGVMGPQDHIDLVLEAIRFYVYELGRHDALFALIGDGEAFNDLCRAAALLCIDEHVRFTGWLDERDCFDYLATAALGLDSNLQAEVTPVKGLEYMAHGVPFVAFDLPETREMAGDAATFVVTGDSAAMAREIARLLDDPRRRRAMGAAGRARVERELAWERQEPRYLDVFARLVGPEVEHQGGGTPQTPREATVEILSRMAVAEPPEQDEGGVEQDVLPEQPVRSALPSRQGRSPRDPVRVPGHVIEHNRASR